MKKQTIQNIFKMMIGTSALIASTAFFINTISPVQASESKLSSEDDKNKMVNVGMESIVVCNGSIYEGSRNYYGWQWTKVGP